LSADITQIGRLPERSVEDRSEVNKILDEGFVCHAAYVVDDRPVVIPTLYARDDDRLLIHGSKVSGLIRAVVGGSKLSVAITHVDGLVVARSGFHSSANYRSIVIHGVGRILEGAEHARALDVIVEALIPGRTADIRQPTKKELLQTAVFELLLENMSAKARTGPPHDDDDDIGTGVWAGVIPLTMVAGKPVAAPDLEPGVETPDYVSPYTR